MTINEARAYLSLDDLEEIQECYENYLFDLKRFFREKQVHLKLYQSKFIKLEKANEAFVTLEFNETFDSADVSYEPSIYSGIILSDFHAFHRVKNQLYALLYQAINISKIKLIAECILDNELRYAQTWKALNDTLPKDIHYKTVDPMMVLTDILAVEKKGIISNQDYNPLLNLDFGNLNAEINRLMKISH
jgi:hypothetical protein